MSPRLADALNRADRLSSASLDRRQVRAARVAAFVVEQAADGDSWEEEIDAEVRELLLCDTALAALQARLTKDCGLSPEQSAGVKRQVEAWVKERTGDASITVNYTPDCVKVDAMDCLDLVDELFPEGQP